MPSVWQNVCAPGALLVALIALVAVCAEAQESAPPRLAEEIVKQERIYQSRGADVPSGYVTYRTLSNYEELLPASFGEALGRLESSDRWLDIGAGRGQALLDYHAPEYVPPICENCAPAGKARVVALSIEDRRTDEWRQQAASLGGDRMRYLAGKRLREYSREELGTFQIITDVYGGFSYTEDLSLFLEKVLGLLDIGGGFYTLAHSVHLEDGKEDPNSWYLTELVDQVGHEVKVCSWLKSISCVKVVCESKSTWEAPTELIQVRKVCSDVSVPRMTLLSYESGNPPGRRFKLGR